MLGAATGISAQTTRDEMYATPEKNGGVYYAYPVHASENTPAPKGYKPFYISHYGRHGSRYLISDNDYSTLIEEMKKAHEASTLTALGEDAYQRLLDVWEEAEGRGGELTPLGVRQHRGIAQRMYAAYPEVFTDKAVMTARSTQVMRCAHSMFSFVEALKELNPKLVIPMESNKRNMVYLCHSEPVSWEFNGDKGPWKQEYLKFRAAKTNSERFVKALFNSDDYILRSVNPDELMWQFYWCAVDMQNMENEATFFDLFEPEELFNLWEAFNAEFYIHNASYPRSNGVNVDNAKNLLTNILTTADEYIANGSNGATLRFGHDGNIVPLAALMQLEGCHGYENDPYKFYQAWTDFKVAPMAANLQIVFFKNKTGNVIVKFMLNEREIAIPIDSDIYPFYQWSDARAFLQKMIDTPSSQYIPEEYK
jgi:hypothetical protein